MFEALILWQLVRARSEQRNQERPAGYGTFEFLLIAAFILTLVAWPVSLAVRLVKMKMKPLWSILISIPVGLLFLFLLPPVYFITGFVWAIVELTIFIIKQQQLEEYE